MRALGIVIVSSLVVLSAAACHTGSSDPDLTPAPPAPGPVDPAPPGPDTPDTDPLELCWHTCSLYEGAEDDRAECSEVQLPLFYDTGDSRTTTVYAKRLLAAGESEAQLWLLHGGPGASGVEDFGFWMDELTSLVDTLDVYTLDHRGVGRSDRLGCPDQEDPGSPGGSAVLDEELQGCVDYMVDHWGDRLDAITTTASARDVGELIEGTRTPGQKIFVWGGSYGSYLGHRYMQLFPEQADGVILEGIAPPGTSFTYFDELFNLNAQKVFDLCGEDPVCSGKLGEDPWELLGDLIPRLDDGSCKIKYYGIDSDFLQTILGGMLYYAGLRELVPAVVYRANRCNEADKLAIQYLAYAMFGSGGVWGETPHYSISLGNHIITSEMWDHADPPSLEELQAIVDAAYITTGAGLRMWEVYEVWPRYPADEYDDRFADYSRPLLMLQGGLDPATTIEKAGVMETAFARPLQTFAYFPNAPHNVMTGSPVDEESLHCGYRIFLDFLRDPYQELDTSCIEDVLPIDFNGSPDYASYLLGTTDTWGDHDRSGPTDGEGERKKPEGLRRLRSMPVGLPFLGR